MPAIARKRKQKVVNLFPGYINNGQKNDVLISRLEWLLDRAKKAEIQSMGFVTIVPGNVIETDWVQSTDSHALVAGAHLLSHRLTKSLQDNA